MTIIQNRSKVFGGRVWRGRPYSQQTLKLPSIFSQPTLGDLLIYRDADHPHDHSTAFPGSQTDEPWANFTTSFMRVEVWDDTNTSFKAAAIDAWGYQWQREFNETGTATVNLQFDDTTLDSVAFGDTIRFYVDVEHILFAMTVEEKEFHQIAEGEEADEYVAVSGRGTLAQWEDAVVYPEPGVDKQPFADNRYFNFSSTYYDDSGWGTPFLQWSPETDQFQGHPYDLFGAPKNWPDQARDVFWIWANNPGGTKYPGLGGHPVGDVYFRKEFSVGADSTVRWFYAVDDNFEAYIDNIPIDTYIGAGTDGWGLTHATDIELTSGTHLLAVKATNVDRPGNPNNIGAFISVGYTIDGDGALNTRVFETDTTWKALAYPTNAPGFTPGHVVRILMDEAQTRGGLDSWDIGCSDFADSHGVAWETTAEITVQIGMDYLSILKQLGDEYIEFFAHQGSHLLHVFAPNSMGHDTRYQEVELVAGVDLKSLTNTQEF